MCVRTTHKYSAACKETARSHRRPRRTSRTHAGNEDVRTEDSPVPILPKRFAHSLLLPAFACRARVLIWHPFPSPAVRCSARRCTLYIRWGSPVPTSATQKEERGARRHTTRCKLDVHPFRKSIGMGVCRLSWYVEVVYAVWSCAVVLKESTHGLKQRCVQRRSETETCTDTATPASSASFGVEQGERFEVSSAPSAFRPPPSTLHLAPCTLHLAPSRYCTHPSQSRS